MSVRRTKNITAAAIRDAMKVAGGIYRMNVPRCVGYMFNASENDVTSGAFVWKHELEKLTPHYDGLITYEDKKLLDIESGETRQLR